MNDPTKKAAIDLIRHFVGYDKNGTKFSRVDASRFLDRLSVALNIARSELELKLEAYSISNQESIRETAIGAFITAWNGKGKSE